MRALVIIAANFLIQSDRLLAECSGFPLESKQYITDLQRLLAFTAPVTHQPEDTHTNTHQEECSKRGLNASGAQSVKASLLKFHSASHIEICCTDDTCKNQRCPCADVTPPLLLIWPNTLTANKDALPNKESLIINH